MSAVPAGIGVRLDHCWVCGVTLLDSGGDASFLRHNHHVIPRAAGGADGPLVSLDSAHHSLLHMVADKMMSGRDWQHLVASLTDSERAKLLYLSTRVVEAFKFVENDPNKRVTIHFSVSRSENEAVKKLGDFHGLSKDRLIRKLLSEEYRRIFQSGK